MKGTKHDQQKPAMSFIPPRALLAVGDAFLAGKIKYGSWNYMNGFKITRPLGGALRHIFQFMAGEDHDEQCSELVGRPVSHLACAVANILMALEVLLVWGEKFDDRFAPEGLAGVNDRFARPSEQSSSGSLAGATPLEQFKPDWELAEEELINEAIEKAEAGG